ncbi:paralemmin-1 isoform X4 [Oncorhynchus tshawytscha]|uniref:Paralemmin-1 n=1 Tax=Oncorhynchus tshawytscha TaxID=74940 RepID=A0AAZ3S7I6_ONCTS|nr:paralemmin-1 isoform X4 [Oncorhynchus tshawytscha]
MEMSEGLSQQERIQAIAEKRKRQIEVENKKRQLEDDRRQLSHLKQKSLREKWLLDGAAGSEQEEAKKQLAEDETKLKGMEESIIRLEQELEELETGVSVTSTKESLTDAAKVEEAKTADNKAPAGTVQVVHEVNGENGVHQLSANEVDELILKADESMMSDATTAGATYTTPVFPTNAELAAEQQTTPKKEITGMEAKAGGASPQPGGGEMEASAENPVTMVFMGYQNVEDETETNKVLGLEGTVKAQLVVIEDGEGKNVTVGPTPATVTVTEGGAKEEQSPPPNGSADDPAKTPQETSSAKEKGGEPEGGTTELNNKEKQPCKCCTIM